MSTLAQVLEADGRVTDKRYLLAELDTEVLLLRFNKKREVMKFFTEELRISPGITQYQRWDWMNRPAFCVSWTPY